MNPEASAPAVGPRPRSRGWERVRLFWGWVCQWYWDEAPTPAMYRAVCDDRDRYAARVRKLEVMLAEARAVEDSAEAEIKVLSAVIARNRERVHAESAIASAERERALVEAANQKAARKD